MGCVADKPINENKCLPLQRAPMPRSPQPNFSHASPQIETLINFRLIEAIKKRDLILLKKVVNRDNISPTDIVGSPDQAKTVLHKLAENNFSEGMALFLEMLASHKSSHVHNVLNMKDVDGNTPLLLCCLSNAVETLEVLSRSQHIDTEAQNFAKKTALEIAVEMESPCVPILTSLSAVSATTKGTFKRSNSGSQPLRSLDEYSRGSQNEEGSSDGNNTRTSLDAKSPTFAGKNSKDIQKAFEDFQFSQSNIRLAQILGDLKTRETSFVDEEFPHDLYYLGGEEAEQVLLKKYPRLKWIRPSEFIGSKFREVSLFDDFEPNSVAKTPLSGCEVYSALAAIAEYPQRLTKIFNIKDVSRYGVYSVNLYIAGLPIELLLDDYFPSIDGCHLLYSKSVTNELWFSLLEKAFAKLHGGYYGLETVGVAEALETLTGMPVAQRPLKGADEDKIWAKLLDYDKKNYIVCAGQGRRVQNLRKNRAYTVVSIAEVHHYRLIKLRNHFDDYTWEGNFSHGSSMWTKELKEQVGYSSAEKTCFYMELKDFLREFESLTVCHYHDGWVHNRLNVECQPNHPTYFELNVEKETEVYISVHQKNPKFVEDSYEYNISPVEIILAKDLEGKALESIAFGEHDAFVGKPSVYVHESHKLKLDPGKYLIYVKVKWVDYKPHDFFLNVFSSLPTQLSKVEQPLGYDFLERVYLNDGEKSKEKFAIANDCLFASGWSGSHLWMYAHNRSDKTVVIEITFEKMINLKLGKKFRAQPNVVKLVIPPLKKVSAYAKRTSSGAVSVGWTFNQYWDLAF